MESNKKTIRALVLALNVVFTAIILFIVYGNVAICSNIVCIVIFSLLCLFLIQQDVISIVKRDIKVLVLADLILAYSLIGNRLFCYPLNGELSLKKLIIFLLFLVLCTPYIAAGKLICNNKKVRVLIRKGSKEGNRPLHIAVFVLIPIIIGVVSMIALNPCVVSYDAYEVIAEAKGLTPIQEYAGVLYVLWYRFLLSIYDSVIFLCLMQIILYAIVIGEFLFFIEKQFEIRFGLLVIILVVFSLMPSNIMMLVTLSKDVYYALSLCFLIRTLMQLQIDSSIRNYFGVGVAMLFVWSIRQSGIVTVLFVILGGVILFHDKKKLIITSIGVIILCIVFNNGLSSLAGAQKIPGGMKYIALYQDILGVYYSGGTLSEEARELVEKGVGDNPEFGDKYTPYWAFYDYYYPELENQDLSSFIYCYLSTFKKNPLRMTHAVLCRMDMIWDIRPGNNAFESWQWRVENSGGKWTYLVKDRNINILTSFYNYMGDASKNYPWKDIVWRVALWNVIFAIFLFYNNKNKGIYCVILPFWGYIFAYLVSLGWSHYRYYWANELMMLMFFLYFLAEDKIQIEE